MNPPSPFILKAIPRREPLILGNLDITSSLAVCEDILRIYDPAWNIPPWYGSAKMEKEGKRLGNCGIDPVI